MVCAQKYLAVNSNMDYYYGKIIGLELRISVFKYFILFSKSVIN